MVDFKVIGPIGPIVAESGDSIKAERDRLRVALEQLRAKARALVAALPKCSDCGKHAVYEFDKDLSRYVSGLCQEHGQGHPYFEKFPDRLTEWAAPLRDLMALLGQELNQ